MYTGELYRQTPEMQRQLSEVHSALNIATDRLFSTFIEIENPGKVNPVTAEITRDTGFEFTDGLFPTTHVEIPTYKTFDMFGRSREGRYTGFGSPFPTKAMIRERLTPTGDYDMPRVPILITKERNIMEGGKNQWKFYAVSLVTSDTAGLVEIRREGLSNSSWTIVNPKGQNEAAARKKVKIANLAGEKEDPIIRVLAIPGTFSRAYEIVLLQSLLIDDICLRIPGNPGRLWLPKRISSKTHKTALDKAYIEATAGANAVPNLTYQVTN